MPCQVPDRGVIEAAAVQPDAPEERVRRQQRPQQIQRGRDIKEVEGGEEGEGVCGADAEGAASDGDEAERSDIEPRENRREDGGGEVVYDPRQGIRWFSSSSSSSSASMARGLVDFVRGALSLSSSAVFGPRSTAIKEGNSKI